MRRIRLAASKILLAFIDFGIINFSVYLAFLVRFDGRIPAEYVNIFLLMAVPTTLIKQIVFLRFGLYRKIWAYASIDALLSIVYAVTIGQILSFAFVLSIGMLRYPSTVSAIAWGITLVTIGGSRLFWRMYRTNYFGKRSKNEQGKRILIYGAGDAGEALLREMQKGKTVYNPIGFIDDNRSKKGMSIHGIRVLGRRQDIPKIARSKNIEELIIAMPSVSGQAIGRIISVCQRSAIRCRTLPYISELINNEVSLSVIREVKEEDVLMRKQVSFDIEDVKNDLKNKIVLITGAGGSIGGELSRQVSMADPRQLIILGHGENSIFIIQNELKAKFPRVDIVPVIADTKDKERIDEIMQKYRPNIVFHAAAYKHVWLMEQNPSEAYTNNVIGTRNVAEAAIEQKVDRFVLISTDKAVEPTSVMGRSKLESEKIVMGLANSGVTKMMACRFGNVLGSRGSVIPIFKKQIEAGGPVTVTHPDVERYFMTIPEAVHLVIRAAFLGNGGEIFVLDMGEQVKIYDIAKMMITMSGLEPDKDIAIEITGLKHGEKLSEKLFNNDEKLVDTGHSKIKRIKKVPSINMATVNG